MRIGFPDQNKSSDSKMMRGYWTICILMGIVGIYLTYSGFAA